MAEFTQNSIHKEMSPHRNVIINTSCHHWKFSFLAQVQTFIFWWVGGGTNFQLLMMSSNLLKSKISISGEGVGGTNFQLLMASSNLLKPKIPISGEGGGWWNQLSTFDAESKFTLKKFFCKKFSKFLGKNWNGFVLNFEYRVVCLYEV